MKKQLALQAGCLFWLELSFVRKFPRW